MFEMEPVPRMVLPQIGLHQVLAHLFKNFLAQWISQGHLKFCGNVVPGAMSTCWYPAKIYEQNRHAPRLTRRTLVTPNRNH